MKVQELIDVLSDYEPDAEVKLAIQPEWAFQHGIGEVVEVAPQIDGARWGVQVRYIDGTDEEFEEAQANTEEAANDLQSDLSFPAERMRDNGIMGVTVGVLIRGEFVPDNKLDSLRSPDATPTIFISDGGQEEYLNEAAAESLGWSRRDR